MASEFDWYEVKFLESMVSLKGVLKDAMGWEPSTKIARHAAVCLQQGRMFFESATGAPLEIRPLLIFYGMLGFARALIVARQTVGLEALAPKHGLDDTSAHDAKLEDLQVKIREERGTFQEFNDIIANLEQIPFYVSYRLHSLTVPTCKADQLRQKILRLRDILSRIPHLRDLYYKTFKEEPKSIICTPTYWSSDLSHGRLQINISEEFENRDTLALIVDNYRKRFPFLNKWCLVEAQRDFGQSILVFSNLDRTNIQEFSETSLLVDGSGMRFFNAINGIENCPRLAIKEIIAPLARLVVTKGLGGTATYAISPFEGIYISDLSLYYLGMFLLSSLVRYRPQILAHAILRQTTSERSADDKALAILEQFTDLSLFIFPKMIVNAISAKVESN